MSRSVTDLRQPIKPNKSKNLIPEIALTLRLRGPARNDALSPIMKRNTTPARWALAVYTVVRDARGRILLLRRTRTRNHFPGCWELPGGKQAPGETFANTALVEVFEESGLEVTLTGVAGAAEGSVPGVRVAMLILEGRTQSTKVILSDEHDEYQWLPLDKVRSLKLRPGFDRFFASYAPGVRAKKK